MQRSQAFKICLLFTALAAAVVGLTFLPVSREGLTIALVLLLGCLCFLPTVLDYLLRRSVDIFEPIHSVCYLSFVSFGLATLYLLYDRQAAYDRRVYPYLNVSLVLVIVGTTTMIYGYFLTRRFNPRKPVPQREGRGAAWIAALFALGVSGQLAGFVAERQLHTVGRVSGLVSLLRQFESFALFGYILLVFLWFSGRATRPQKLVLFSIVLPVESLWMIAHIGGKAVTLTVLGLPLVAFWYWHSRLPRKATMALILLTVFLIFP